MINIYVTLTTQSYVAFHRSHCPE